MVSEVLQCVYGKVLKGLSYSYMVTHQEKERKMKIAGRSIWMPSEIMTWLYKDGDYEADVLDLLRNELGLDPPVEPRKVGVTEKRTRFKYDVSDLGVGETRIFTVENNKHTIIRSIRVYAERNGQQYAASIVADGLQFKREL